MDSLLVGLGTLLICFVGGLVFAMRWYFNKKNQAIDAIITLAQAGGDYLKKQQEQRQITKK